MVTVGAGLMRVNLQHGLRIQHMSPAARRFPVSQCTFDSVIVT
jgi:hypothetical protein